MGRIPGGPDRFRAFAFGVGEETADPVGQLTSLSGYVKIRGRRALRSVFDASWKQFFRTSNRSGRLW